jgi:hypothetical protein
MKKIYILIFIYTIVLSADTFSQEFPQRQKYFTFGFNYSPLGVGFSHKISGTGEQMHRTPFFIAGKSGRDGRVALAGFTSLGVNTGFFWQDKHGKNFTSVSLELQQNRASYSFHQPFVTTYTSMPEQDHDLDDTIPIVHRIKYPWMEMDRYLKYSVSVQRFWLITDGSNVVRNDGYYNDDEVFSYVKLSFGQSFLHRSMGHIIKTGDAETYSGPDGNYMSATTVSVNPRSYMIGAEVGIRVLTAEGKNCFDVGAGYCFALNSTYTRNYTFYKDTYNSSPGSTSIGGNSYSFSGGSVYLNMSYSFNSKIKSKPPDTLMQEKHHEKPQPVAHVHKPHHLNGRKVRVHDEIDSDEETLTIQVYDKGKVDGDRISLYLNGELLLEDYTVGKIKKELTLHLKPGENYLVMHARNLGRIPPNTAAIRIYKNGRPKDIILNSDMDKSGGLKINYKGENG